MWKINKILLFGTLLVLDEIRVFGYVDFCKKKEIGFHFGFKKLIKIIM